MIKGGLVSSNSTGKRTTKHSSQIYMYDPRLGEGQWGVWDINATPSQKIKTDFCKMLIGGEVAHLAA